MANSKTVKAVPAFEAKTHFGQLLDEVDQQGVRFVVERRGKPIAVIIGVDEFEEMLEIAGEESDSAFQKSLRAAQEEYELGKTISLDDLKTIHEEMQTHA
jgi:prevent-host-death family protein